MSLERTQLIVSVVIAAGAVGFWLNGRRRQARHGAALRAYNDAAYVPVVEPAPDDNFVYVTRLAFEMKSPTGQLAVVVEAESPATAIHHINLDGTFSSQGPYFIAQRSRYWHSTNTKHLVKTLRGKEDWGFKPDHHSQQGLIREKGVAIIEYSTTKYAPVDIAEFSNMDRNQ